MSTCPSCGTEIRSVGVGYCLDCGVYTDWADHPKPAKKRTDDRCEKQIQHAIRKVLESLPVAVYDTSQPFAAKITPGLPDLVIIGMGGVLFVEVKRADGDLTIAQEQFRDACLANGVPWACWRHEDEAVAWAQSRRAAA